MATTFMFRALACLLLACNLGMSVAVRHKDVSTDAFQADTAVHAHVNTHAATVVSQNDVDEPKNSDQCLGQCEEEQAACEDEPRDFGDDFEVCFENYRLCVENCNRKFGGSFIDQTDVAERPSSAHGALNQKEALAASSSAEELKQKGADASDWDLFGCYKCTGWKPGPYCMCKSDGCWHC
mmetsp:Transcript_65416/g.121995  ORF Transcript_65416/g.121995 Transcript_65416/m.121995 type:complete len:181 (-) Transcript_65416:72-614(-)